MGFITSAGENYLLSLVANAETPLPQMYVALMLNQAPSRFIGGGELDEPTVTEYARAVVLNAGGSWTARQQYISNVRDITFPTAVTNWGLVKHWALCDASSGGRVLWAGSLPTPIYVQAGAQPYLPAGTLTLSAAGYTTQVVI